MANPYRIQQAKEFENADAILESLDALLDEVLELEQVEARRERIKRAFAGMLVTFGRQCASEGWDGK